MFEVAGENSHPLQRDQQKIHDMKSSQGLIIYHDMKSTAKRRY
jgi:hypothetical protein